MSTSTNELVSLQSTSDTSSVIQPSSLPLVTINDETSLSSLLPSSSKLKGSMKKAASSSDSWTAAFASPLLDDPSFLGLGHLFFRWPVSPQFQQGPFAFRSPFLDLSDRLSPSSFFPSFSRRCGLGRNACCERWRSASSDINDMRASGAIVLVVAYIFADASWPSARLARK